jgi:hypothetical protein
MFLKNTLYGILRDNTFSLVSALWTALRCRFNIVLAHSPPADLHLQNCKEMF